MKEIQWKLTLVQVIRSRLKLFQGYMLSVQGEVKRASLCSLCCLSAEAPFASNIKIKVEGSYTSKNPTILLSFSVGLIILNINRGYYMATWRNKISVCVLKHIFDESMQQSIVIFFSTRSKFCISKWLCK